MVFNFVLHARWLKLVEHPSPFPPRPHLAMVDLFNEVISTQEPRQADSLQNTPAAKKQKKREKEDKVEKRVMEEVAAPLKVKPVQANKVFLSRIRDRTASGSGQTTPPSAATSVIDLAKSEEPTAIWNICTLCKKISWMLKKTVVNPHAPRFRCLVSQTPNRARSGRLGSSDDEPDDKTPKTRGV